MERDFRKGRFVSQTSELTVGAQSYSFRQFDFEGSITCLKQLGVPYIEYCSAHFPPDAGHADFARIKRRLGEEGVKTLCFGVEAFTADEAGSA
jgi:hypothetical protein